MKFLTTLIIIFSFTALVAEAQLRKDLQHQPEEYTGAVTHTHQASSPGSWMNLLNMTMSHSYSMSFTNFGGQTHNLNAYTNSMFFDVSDKLDAQLDVSVLHSPFGNSFMNNTNNLGTQIIIDSAKIDYKFSENTRLSIEFSQNPYRSMYGGYNSPFRRTPFGY
ncbi:hypothetical protein [Rhodohalobacter halophilus]|uniref:hypothetical protein n=1 Tax=Rhodohalobacter halophilus TaxID=1812810 RepID=UPI00083F873E|nr:hypothetical protein [Rhodohalobacter halophilus]